MAHANEDLLRRGYAAFAASDLNTVLALFDDGIVWHNGGSNQLSGDYHGKQEVLGFFGKLLEVAGGSFHLEIHDTFANDSRGVVTVTSMPSATGRR